MTLSGVSILIGEASAQSHTVAPADPTVTAYNSGFVDGSCNEYAIDHPNGITFDQCRAAFTAGQPLPS